ncbi:hypothetical protein F4804DRAFT_262963 [Jackrogersella minutella]|nr:hypothetical protein F4804DRAFT_262963 [Jackrogersella minutella]
MAVIELVFPQLKSDPDSLKQALSKLPIAFEAFKDGGVKRGLQGFISTENGKDVSGDHREVLVLEWPQESTFYEFIKSPSFANFMGHLKPFVNGPPELDLFETNDGSPLFSARPVLEILIIRPKSASTDEDLQTILKKVQTSLEKSDDFEAVYGSSTNLPKKIATIVRVFASKEEREAAKSTSSRQEILNELSSLAEVTELVAEPIKQLPL